MSDDTARSPPALALRARYGSDRPTTPKGPAGTRETTQIEIFFSILYRRLLKHGMFTSEEDLAEQILAFVETYNQTAKPFKWIYTGKALEA